jgi:hypothetical protein
MQCKESRLTAQILGFSLVQASITSRMHPPQRISHSREQALSGRGPWAALFSLSSRRRGHLLESRGMKTTTFGHPQDEKCPATVHD